jgi:hypothetical protein
VILTAVLLVLVGAISSLVAAPKSFVASCALIALTILIGTSFWLASKSRSRRRRRACTERREAMRRDEAGRGIVRGVPVDGAAFEVANRFGVDLYDLPNLSVKTRVRAYDVEHFARDRDLSRRYSREPWFANPYAAWAGVALLTVAWVSWAHNLYGRRSDRSDEAFNICQRFVSDRLKAPSTATFAYQADSTIVHSGHLYRVDSYVDAQNSFGAKLRSYYHCVVKPSGDGWTLVRISGLG